MTGKIRKLADDNGLTVVDLSKVSLGEDVECIATNDHPNLLGTTLMARKTARVILEK